MDHQTKIKSNDIQNESQIMTSPNTLAVLAQSTYDRDAKMYTPPKPTLGLFDDDDDDTKGSNSPIQEEDLEVEPEVEKKNVKKAKIIEQTEIEPQKLEEPNILNTEQAPNKKDNPNPEPTQTNIEKMLQGFISNMNTNFNKLDSNIQKLDSNTQRQLAQLHSSLTNIETKMRQELETKLEQYKQNITEETNAKLMTNTNKIIANTGKITENTTKLEKLKTQVETHIQKIEKTLTETKDILNIENKDNKNLKITKQKETTENTITWTFDKNNDTPTEQTDRPNHRTNNPLTTLLKEDKPLFDGTNPERFLEKLESYLKAFMLNEQELLENFHIFLRNKALQWWYLIKQEIDTWEDAKTRILTYWIDKDKIKETWEKLTFRQHFDIERFIMTAMEIQNQLKQDRPTEKKIEKITIKLPSPLKEMLFMKKSKTIEQFLTDVKELRKICPLNTTYPNNYDTQEGRRLLNIPLSPKKSPNRIVYNSNFKKEHTKDTTWPLPQIKDSPFYSWDTSGNAYDPNGVCVWENKMDHPQKGKKYVSAIFQSQDNFPTETDEDQTLD